MTATEFEKLLTDCQGLSSEQKTQLIKVLLGDRNIRVGFPPREENILSTNSIPLAIKMLAESLKNRSGGRFRFELYREMEPV